MLQTYFLLRDAVGNEINEALFTSVSPHIDPQDLEIFHQVFTKVFAVVKQRQEERMATSIAAQLTGLGYTVSYQKTEKRG